MRGNKQVALVGSKAQVYLCLASRTSLKLSVLIHRSVDKKIFSSPIKSEWPIFAGLYAEGLELRLQHMCDAAMVLVAVHDDSDLVRIIPDPKRHPPHLHILFLQSAHSCGNYAAFHFPVLSQICAS